jgi:hypothetical protein
VELQADLENLEQTSKEELRLAVQGGGHLSFSSERVEFRRGSGSQLLANPQDLEKLEVRFTLQEGTNKAHCGSALVLWSRQQPILLARTSFRIYDEPGDSWEIYPRILQNCQHIAARLGIPLVETDFR